MPACVCVCVCVCGRTAARLADTAQNFLHISSHDHFIHSHTPATITSDCSNVILFVQVSGPEVANHCVLDSGWSVIQKFIIKSLHATDISPYPVISIN